LLLYRQKDQEVDSMEAEMEKVDLKKNMLSHENLKISISPNSIEEEYSLQLEAMSDPLDQAAHCSQLFNSEVLNAFSCWKEQQVAHARDRIIEGKAGICEECGGEIPYERLQVKPDATRCLKCQAICERRNANFVRW